MRQHPRYATYLVVSFLVKRQMGNRAGVCVCVCEGYRCDDVSTVKQSHYVAWGERRVPEPVG